ncbi:MAG: hypothetical protein GX493_02635 [Firmicutes bacterium]|nr:hypothetical protein [Bacillota bacterium]
MRTTFRLKHEPDYYRGLGLLLASCLTLVWALWRDAFTPQVFLAGFLCFSWGYAFLWRHDLYLRLSSLQAEVEDLKRRLQATAVTGEEEAREVMEASTTVWTQEILANPAAETSLPDDTREAENGEGQDLL